MLLLTDSNPTGYQRNCTQQWKGFFLATLASHPESTVPHYCPLAILVLHPVQIIGVRQEVTGKTVWKCRVPAFVWMLLFYFGCFLDYLWTSFYKKCIYLLLLPMAGRHKMFLSAY